LAKAISILTPIQQTYGDDISWADLVQMAGAVAVEHAGGPPLTQHMRYGRVDATLKQVTHANIDPQLLLPCHQAPFHDGEALASIEFYLLCFLDVTGVALPLSVPDLT